MSIKPLHLMKQTPRPAEIADGAFRSLQEVQKYLDGIETDLNDLDGLIKQYQLQFSKVQQQHPVTAAESIIFDIDVNTPKGPRKPKGGNTINTDIIDKVVIPKIDVLRKNFTIVDEIADKVDDLDKLYNSTSVNFRGIRGSNEMLKAIKSLQRTAKSSLDKALTFLGDIGERHTPKNFKDLIKDTITQVSPELTFKSHKTFMYGYETKDGNLAFAVYLELTSLTDDEGNIYPKFYIVFNCVLKPTKDLTKVEPIYYLTVMHDFATPGKYALGRKVTSSKEAATMLGTMLEMENIYTAIGTQPHNLNPDDYPKGKFEASQSIESIEFTPSSINFMLKKGVKAKDIQAVAVSLLKDVKGIFAKIKKATVSMKIDQSADPKVIKFTLTNLSPENKVSVNDIDFLQDQFGLDAKKLRRVIDIINMDNE